MAPAKKTRKAVSRDVGDAISANKRGKKSATTTARRAKAVISKTDTTSELKKWRKNMEKWIDAKVDLPPADKTDLKENVAMVADEVSKGKGADPGRLERLLNLILGLAPDIFDVAITTLANPLAGLGLVAKKIGERAKVEWQTAAQAKAATIS